MYRTSRSSLAVWPLVAAAFVAATVCGPTLYGQTLDTPAPADDVREPAAVTPPPAHISLVDGSATHERDARAEQAQANMAVAPGDRVRTEEGRVEILFTDGSLLHLDRHSVVDVMADSMLRLRSGRVFVIVSSGARADQYRVDTPNASVRIQQAGEYRISTLTGTLGDEVELAVLRGVAELATSTEAMPVHAGQRSLVRGDQLPSYPTSFNSARRDAFDAWSEQRREAHVGSASARYLPPEVRTYAGVFDRDGYWDHDPSYGYVWYPRAAVGWRPYYNGVWVPTRRWGSFWLGWDSWGWPTHHYGRWGFSPRGSWFWIPARRWAPAWVSWAISPGFVGWCPLGMDGRAVFGFASRGDLYRAHGAYDPWRAWTFMPRRHFGSFVGVPTVMIDGHRLDARMRSGFVTQNIPPGFAARNRVSIPPAAPSAGAAIGNGRTVAGPRVGPAPAQPSPYDLAAPRYRSVPRPGAAPGPEAPAPPRPDYPEFRRRAPDRTIPTADSYGIAVPRQPRNSSAPATNESPVPAQPRTDVSPRWPEPRRWRDVAPPTQMNEPFRSGPRYRDVPRPGGMEAAPAPAPGYVPRWRGPSTVPSAPPNAPDSPPPTAHPRGGAVGAPPASPPPPPASQPAATAPRRNRN